VLKYVVVMTCIYGIEIRLSVENAEQIEVHLDIL
jgi:hypothetical protein